MGPGIRGGRWRSAVAPWGALLALASCAGLEEPRQPTEILWDTWGVPHVFAPDGERLHRAFGWAQMASHGDLVLRLYGQARGRAAEYWGPVYAEGDRFVRTAGVPGRAREWYAALEPEERTHLDAFVAGINGYAEAHGARLTDEMEVVLPVTGPDVLAHLQRVLHLTFIAGEAAPALKHWAAQPLPEPEPKREPEPAAARSGSNAWALGPRKATGGHAMLLANPHLPWSGMSLFYEAQVACPGVNASGATLVGMPVLAIAFTDYLGWTHTVSTFDGVDLFELTVSDSGYAWDGGVRPFEGRPETMRIRQPDGGTAAETWTVHSSVHGPVVARQDGRAVAMRVVGLDQPHLISQYWQMVRARSLGEFETALARLQMPCFNVVYADRDGHVLYVFGGRTPRRPFGDWARWQGVVRGDTSATLWTETHPYADLPRALDPPSGWVHNANDTPWTSTFPPVLWADDYPPYLAPRFMSFRSQRSVRLVAGAEALSFEEMVRRKHSTRMEQADRLVPDLVEAARSHGGPLARDAADVLEQWDCRAQADSRGAVLFQAWVQAAGGRTAVFAEPWNEDDLLETPRGLSDPAAAVAVLEEVAGQVRAQHGTLSVAWGEVNRFRYGSLDLAANGGHDGLGLFRAVWFAPDRDGRYRATGGDSYVLAVEFSEPVRAEAVLGYGNASQPGSPHRYDQLGLMARQQLRPVWRRRAEVEAHLESRESFDW